MDHNFVAMEKNHYKGALFYQICLDTTVNPCSAEPE